MTMKRFCATALLLLWSLCALAVQKSGTIVYINGSKFYVHTVQPGETLYGLSKAASPFRNGMILSMASIVSFLFPLSNIAVTKHSSASKFIARSIIIPLLPSYVSWISPLSYSAPVLLPLPENLLKTAAQISSLHLLLCLQVLPFVADSDLQIPVPALTFCLPQPQKVSVHFLLLFLSYVPFPLPFHAFHPDTFPCL